MLQGRQTFTFSAIFSAILLLLLFSVTLSYQLIVNSSYSSDWKETVEFNHKVKTCEQAKNKAIKDYHKGLIRMYFDGGTSKDYPDKFPYNFYRKLEQNFDIDVIDTGHSGSSLHKCYNLKMDNLLDEKLGQYTIEDLFNKLRDQEYSL